MLVSLHSSFFTLGSYKGPTYSPKYNLDLSNYCERNPRKRDTTQNQPPQTRSTLTRQTTHYRLSGRLAHYWSAVWVWLHRVAAVNSPLPASTRSWCVPFRRSTSSRRHSPSVRTAGSQHKEKNWTFLVHLHEVRTKNVASVLRLR